MSSAAQSLARRSRIGAPRGAGRAVTSSPPVGSLAALCPSCSLDASLTRRGDQPGDMAKSFGATSTTDDVLEGVSLSGKRILVTGVSAGLDVETARALAAHGAQVVGAARNLA